MPVLKIEEIFQVISTNVHAREHSLNYDLEKPQGFETVTSSILWFMSCDFMYYIMTWCDFISLCQFSREFSFQEKCLSWFEENHVSLITNLDIIVRKLLWRLLLLYFIILLDQRARLHPRGRLWCNWKRSAYIKADIKSSVLSRLLKSSSEVAWRVAKVKLFHTLGAL